MWCCLWWNVFDCLLKRTLTQSPFNEVYGGINEEKKVEQKLIDYYLWIPFSGLVLLFFLNIWYFLYQNEAITWWRILWNLIPFIGFNLVSLPIYVITKAKPPFLIGNWKWITLFLIMIPFIVYIIIRL